MRRREFIGLITAAATWPIVTRAQQSPMPVIGFLIFSSLEEYGRDVNVFREGLREAGYAEGENIAIDVSHSGTVSMIGSQSWQLNLSGER